MAFLLKRLFLALDLLHRECHVAHTDIKEANILLPADASVLTQFENRELEEPSPKKEVEGSVIYLSREMDTPRSFGAPVLCDFGSAVPTGRRSGVSRGHPTRHLSGSGSDSGYSVDI
jgi:serine/threonine protein kinase